MPGKSENNNGDLNLWRPSQITPKQGDARWFHEHLDYLFGADSEHVLNWTAWVYQHQDQHPKHALLTHGEIQGTGKSVVANVMKRLLGTTNCTMLDQGALDLARDGWKVRTKLIVIEEVRPAFGSNNALAKKLHPLISEDTVHVDMKNRNDFDMPNVMAVLCGSNKTGRHHHGR
jgi:putative DNA primase/helicase